MKIFFGKIFEKLRLPGILKPFHYSNGQNDIQVSLRTSAQYSILTVNGLEMYFHRESGRFDGVGTMSLDDPTPVNGLLADRIRRSRPTMPGDPVNFPLAQTDPLPDLMNSIH